MKAEVYSGDYRRSPVDLPDLHRVWMVPIIRLRGSALQAHIPYWVRAGSVRAKYSVRIELVFVILEEKLCFSFIKKKQATQSWLVCTFIFLMPFLISPIMTHCGMPVKKFFGFTYGEHQYL